jgi:hypothetical protein
MNDIKSVEPKRTVTFRGREYEIMLGMEAMNKFEETMKRDSLGLDWRNSSLATTTMIWACLVTNVPSLAALKREEVAKGMSIREWGAIMKQIYALIVESLPTPDAADDEAEAKNEPPEPTTTNGQAQETGQQVG